MRGIVKGTTSTPIMIDSANETADVQSGATGKLVSSNSVEITMASLRATGSSAGVTFYDTNDPNQCTINNQRTSLAANQGESVPLTLFSPLLFTKGLCIIFDTGGTFGAELSLGVLPLR